MKQIIAIFLMGVFSMGAIDQTKATTPPQEVAIFAGGCFWCVEDVFEKMPGILSVVSGYTGGSVKDPTYEAVSNGGTGHYEAVQVTFDPSKVSYKDLLPIFWHNIDPFDPLGQFCDKGNSYKAVIFYSNDTQKKLAEASKSELEQRFQKPIVTQIIAASTFYPAEDYHQDYASKNPLRYSFYRGRCGRDERLQEIWGDDAKKHNQ